MTDIRRFDSGPRLSEALIYGDRIYTSGFVADSMAGKSVLEQTRDILQQIDAVLERAGSDKNFGRDLMRAEHAEAVALEHLRDCGQEMVVAASFSTHSSIGAVTVMPMPIGLWSTSWTPVRARIASMVT